MTAVELEESRMTRSLCSMLTVGKCRAGGDVCDDGG